MMKKWRIEDLKGTKARNKKAVHKLVQQVQEKKKKCNKNVSSSKVNWRRSGPRYFQYPCELLNDKTLYKIYKKHPSIFLGIISH
jgi:hypothetical protein